MATRLPPRAENNLFVSLKNLFQPLQNNLGSKTEVFARIIEIVQSSTHTQQLIIFKYIIAYPNIDNELQKIDAEISNALNILLKPNSLFSRNDILDTSAANLLFLIYTNIVGMDRAFNDKEFNQPGFKQFLLATCDITGQNFINASSRINDDFPHLKPDSADIVMFKIRGEELSVTIEKSAYSQLLKSAESKLDNLVASHIRKEKPYLDLGFNSPAIFLGNRDDFFDLCLRMTNEQLEEFINTDTLPCEHWFRIKSHNRRDFSGIFTELRKITAIKFSEDFNLSGLNEAKEFESKEINGKASHNLQQSRMGNFSFRENIESKRKIIADEEKVDKRLLFNTPETAGKYLLRFLECSKVGEIHLIVKSILGVVDSSRWPQEIQIALKLIKEYRIARISGQEFTLLEIEILFIAYLKLFGVVEKGYFDIQELRKYLRECGGREFNLNPLFVVVEEINQDSVTVRVNGGVVTIKQDLKRIKLMWDAVDYIHNNMSSLDTGRMLYFSKYAIDDLCGYLLLQYGAVIEEDQIRQIILILEKNESLFPEKELRELLLHISLKTPEINRKDARRACEVIIELCRKNHEIKRFTKLLSDIELILFLHELPGKWYRSVDNGRFNISGFDKMSDTGKRIAFIMLNHEAGQLQDKTRFNKFNDKFGAELIRKFKHNLLTYDTMEKAAQETLVLGEILPEEDQELRTYLSGLPDKQLSDFIQNGDIIRCVEGYEKDKPFRIEHLYKKREQRQRFIEYFDEIKKKRNVEYVQSSEDQLKRNVDYIIPLNGDFFEEEFHIVDEKPFLPSAPYIDEAEFEQLCRSGVSSTLYKDDVI